jgi:hypothetical protein
LWFGFLHLFDVEATSNILLKPVKIKKVDYQLPLVLREERAKQLCMKSRGGTKEKCRGGAKTKEVHVYNTFKYSSPLKYLLLLWLKKEYIKQNSGHSGGLGPC